MIALHQEPRRRWFARGWFHSKVGVLAVLGIFIVSASANFEAGQALSVDPMTSWTLGIASICVDIMKSVAFFIVVSAAINRRWLAVGVAFVIFALCGTWSLTSATRFMFGTLEQHQADTQLKAKLQETDLDILSLRTTRAGFLAQQQTKVSGPRGARTDAMEANKQTSSEFKSLIKDIEAQRSKLEEAKAVVGQDALASALDVLGIDVSSPKINAERALIFALILEVVSSLGFWVIVQSRHPQAAPILVSPIAQDELTLPVLVSPTPAPEPPKGGYEDEVLPPMPEVIAAPEPVLPDNVTPLFPKKTGGLAVLLESVTAPGDPIRAICKDLFETCPGERCLYKGVVDLINSRLPETDQIERPQYDLILTALAAEFPVRKCKTGGRIYIYGIRPRSYENRMATA
jgi:hypothetical protein